MQSWFSINRKYFKIKRKVNSGFEVFLTPMGVHAQSWKNCNKNESETEDTYFVDIPAKDKW